jgi:hypothetical protein
MAKTINHTGRKRIDGGHVRIDLERTTRPIRLVARFDLATLKLPPGARIWIEPFHGDLAERLDFGTVAEPVPHEPPVLRELNPDQRGFAFRVKVVDAPTGRLLALARRLPVGDPSDGRRELFKVCTRELGEEVWKVELDEASPPTLVLNRDIPDLPARLRSDAEFRAIVLPAAMRAVLLQMALTRREADEDEDVWENRWFGFAEECAGEERPDSDDRDGWIGWIDRACAGLARRHRLASALRASSPGTPPR